MGSWIQRTGSDPPPFWSEILQNHGTSFDPQLGFLNIIKTTPSEDLPKLLILCCCLFSKTFSVTRKESINTDARHSHQQPRCLEESFSYSNITHPYLLLHIVHSLTKVSTSKTIGIRWIRSLRISLFWITNIHGERESKQAPYIAKA